MNSIRRFIDSEAAGGVLLLVAALAAILIDNSPIAGFYDRLLNTNFSVEAGTFALNKPILLWINDGLMAIFFLLVGLEIKREFLAGELRSRDQALLPGLAALGGIAVPAIIFAAINWNHPELLKGWAIPAATDIAFALSILALLGNRVPLALKIFLMTLAILDDLGAIVVIALFYTEALSPTYLAFAALSLVALYGLNKAGVRRISPYFLIGIALWIFILKSGVHATLAGVLLALFVPMKRDEKNSPVEKLEHGLHPYVVYFIMPLFAFANGGVSFTGFTPAALLQPLPLGIILGLVVGKQIGITGMTWLALRFNLVKLPEQVTMTHIYGVSCLAGIGFTMSLFIGMLAYETPAYSADVRFGVISASLVAGFLGYWILRLTGKGKYERS